MEKLAHYTLVWLITLHANPSAALSSPTYPGKHPGTVQSRMQDQSLTLMNAVIQAQWQRHQGNLESGRMTDRLLGSRITGSKELFAITLRDTRVIRPRDMTIVTPPAIHRLKPQASAQVRAARDAGQAIQMEMKHEPTGLHVQWQAVLRDGSNAVRMEVTFTATAAAIPLADVCLAELHVAGAATAGQVKGSPVTTDTLFFGFEHPLAENSVTGGTVYCRYPCRLTLKPNQPKTFSVVIGVVPRGQMRRGFLYYLERERAHPYRPFLHYNSWYHLNIGRPHARMTETELLSAVDAVGTELVTKRGVILDAFVPDDGWDDFDTLWGFHDGFPQGFSKVAQQANRYQAGLGVWMSPWGGYGDPKQARMRFGASQGFEVNQNGFSMAGPNYHARFRNTCFHMIRDYGINYFKFDGMGGGNFSSGASEHLMDDVEAIFQLTDILRQKQPHLFINATVGTWPSPFWTRYADSIWRQGGDTGFSGVGNSREQWLTYRDQYAYDRIVKRGPLYPLNALMFHGLTIGERENPGKMSMNEDSVRHEIRTMFGCGTGLQELYIAPHLLTPTMWDDLADAAKWSRRNTDVLVDTHWIGGDPNALEVYGWAAWCQRQAAVTLRNPDSKSRIYTLNVNQIFELPAGASTSYSLESPFDDQRIQQIAIGMEQPVDVELAPFEVLVFDAIPNTEKNRSIDVSNSGPHSEVKPSTALPSRSMN